MCLGAKARAHNEQLKRDYKYKLEKREREWMQTISLTGVERIQYEHGIDASNLGLANVYTEIQEKHGKLVDEMIAKSFDDKKAYLSKNLGDEFKASGRLGKSADRIAAVELGEYLKKGHDMAHQLGNAVTEMNKAGMKAAGQARSEQMQMFANQAFVKVPGMLPPKPVGQNVGHAAFMDALSIVGTVASIAAVPATGGGSLLFSSDRDLKENIKKLGKSPSGIGIYKFNYIGNAKKYIGTMADDVMKVMPEAVSTMANGFLGVNYNLIDVQFKEVV